MGIEAAIAAPIVGSAIGMYGANRAAQKQQAGIDRQINAMREQAALAREAAKFRPVGVTSPYGTADIQVGPEGQLTSVGFQLSPEEQARASRFGMLGETALAGLTIDPMAAAQRQIEQIAELRRPGRELAQERLFGDLASKGLLGLGVQAGTGAPVNPLAQSLFAAQEREDMATALAAEEAARGRIREDFNLAQTLFGAQRGVQNLGTAELERALNIADQERLRQMGSAQTQAGFSQQIGQLGANRANIGAQKTAAIYGGIGSAVGGMGGMFGGGGSQFAGTGPGTSMFTGGNMPNSLMMYGGQPQYVGVSP